MAHSTSLVQSLPMPTNGSGFQLQFDPATDPAPLRPQQDPLASTGSIIVAGSETQECLLAVNAGNKSLKGRLWQLPFSFTFDDSGNLLLIELAGIEGSFDRGVVSVMANIDSNPPLLTSEAESGATATCWIEYNPLTSCIYTTNNGSRSISSFYLNEDSEVELVSNDLGGGLDAPTDMIQSSDSKYLYALSTGDCGLKQVQVIADGLDDEATRSATDGGVVNGYVGLALF
eukprot:scaffold514_cov121-Skeletonema_marinoi.AAC.9